MSRQTHGEDECGAAASSRRRAVFTGSRGCVRPRYRFCMLDYERALMQRATRAMPLAAAGSEAAARLPPARRSRPRCGQAASAIGMRRPRALAAARAPAAAACGSAAAGATPVILPADTWASPLLTQHVQPAPVHAARGRQEQLQALQHAASVEPPLEWEVQAGVVEGTWRWNGFTCRFLRSGDAAAAGHQGPPLVLVHGFLASADLWRHNLGPLGQHCRTYALDLLGACLLCTSLGLGQGDGVAALHGTLMMSRALVWQPIPS